MPPAFTIWSCASRFMVTCIRAPAAFSCAMSDAALSKATSLATPPSFTILALFSSWPTDMFHKA